MHKASKLKLVQKEKIKKKTSHDLFCIVRLYLKVYNNRELGENDIDDLETYTKDVRDILKEGEAFEDVNWPNYLHQG